MPIEYQIDYEHRLVSAKAVGVLSEADIYSYQKKVWSQPDVAGFNELIDMSLVEQIETPSRGQVRELAAHSASMDPATPASKFAIVAPQHLAFGLGRMYEAYRGLESGSTKEVGVFRTMAEALAFLGVTDTTSEAQKS